MIPTWTVTWFDLAAVLIITIVACLAVILIRKDGS
jgi:hypothetical protein